ncbi:MAG TPA: PilZ domain-containing protein [Candidatus Sulfotelmatobacter sp.]|jgi:c-di-GMP-binding flagellar brake protein YcgR|nr:PilZ domain-containing protein [Candidatus Sulfotelmatobacter sp.]
MSLKSLVLCSDEKIVRVLRRVLGDLDIAVELCHDSDAALRKLTRERFEAIIVDIIDDGASEVLRSARSAPCNKQAVAVAIVDPVIGLKAVFEIGAHFVLYKPVSSERAKSSFRAARALMKSERRRNARVAVHLPVSLQNPKTGASMRVTTSDLSEGGMAVGIRGGHRPTGRWQAAFTLPGTEIELELPAEFAWEGAGAQAGLRFLQIAPETTRQLRDWLKLNSADAEQDDPPIRCQLTDLSLGACYLEISSPFPVSSRVTLSMKAAGVEVRAQGLVRVMHPDKGMGVEFTQTTPEHSAAVERFLGVLSENRTLLPELLVEPEGLETDARPSKLSAPGMDDPLLQLFSAGPLTTEAFHDELRKQRASTPPIASSPAAGASA